MFNAKDEAPRPHAGKELETVIGPSVKVDGTFRGEGNIIIEGTVSGSVKTEKNVTIGQHAKVAANVTAANAKISGEVRGAIRVKGRLEITETARIIGDIETEVLSIAPGALVNGKCTMGKDATAAENANTAVTLNADAKRLEKKR